MVVLQDDTEHLSFMGRRQTEGRGEVQQEGRGRVSIPRVDDGCGGGSIRVQVWRWG